MHRTHGEQKTVGHAAQRPWSSVLKASGKNATIPTSSPSAATPPASPIVRHHPPQRRPEPGCVFPVSQVNQLMRHHVVHQPHGGLDDPPAEPQVALGFTSPSAASLVADQHQQRGHAHLLGHDRGPHGQAHCGVEPVPGHARFPHCGCAAHRHGHHQPAARERNLGRCQVAHCPRVSRRSARTPNQTGGTTVRTVRSVRQLSVSVGEAPRAWSDGRRHEYPNRPM